MRTISRTVTFKRDFKRETKRRHGSVLEDTLRDALALLIEDQSLPPRYRDHGLTGHWKDHRDCHLKPDLILIYRLPDAETLELVRLGSHSELSL